MYPNQSRRRSRSCSNSFRQSLNFGTQPPLGRPLERSHSLRAVDRDSEGVKYEGNLRRFYQQRDYQPRSDPREQMLNNMRAEVTAQRRVNPNQRSFDSTIVPQFQQNREQIRVKRRQRRKLKRQRQRQRRREAGLAQSAPDWYGESSNMEMGTEPPPHVFDDDTNLYWERDRQFRNAFRESERSNRFGPGYDNSYTVRSRLMEPIVQRSPTMRDRLNRNLATYQIREAQTPKYFADRQSRLRSRRPPYVSSTLHENRPLLPIPEVRDIDEQRWYTLDEPD